MTILVCGATGNTGSEVLRQLRAAHAAVRALTRSESTAARLRADGIETVVADLAKPDTLPPALDGIDSVYIATSTSPELAEHEANLARCAASAGARHLVKLSVIGASADSPLTFARMHNAAEQAIHDAGLPATVVRPNGFMQNTLAWAAQLPSGIVRGPVIDARWSIVDARDIAAVAVAALLDPATHGGERYTITGPEASSAREQVAILSELLGRPLQAAEITIDQAQDAMMAAGWSEWNAARMGELFRLYADGLAEQTSPDLERVTGRPPRTYRQFAEEHRDAFLTQ